MAKYGQELKRSTKNFILTVYLIRIPRLLCSGDKVHKIQFKDELANLLSSLCGGALHTPQLCCAGAPSPFDLKIGKLKFNLPT
jgi:hypothetical protein